MCCDLWSCFCWKILSSFLLSYKVGMADMLHSMVGIGYPKFGYPRVIPGPEPNFGYGLGWVCVWIPWVFSGWVPIKFKNLGFFGYYPWVPMRIGYPKFGHPRVIPELYYDKKYTWKIMLIQALDFLSLLTSSKPLISTDILIMFDI